jgi:hypothetical protein
MTEVEWLSCSDPSAMLEFVGKANDRKVRLFASACCYRLWDWLSDECRQMLKVFERHADDPQQPDVGDIEFRAAFQKAGVAAPEALKGAFDAGLIALCEYWDVVATAEEEENEEENRTTPDLLTELETQVHLVHDIFGNPFCPACINPTWLAWNDGTVVKLAHSINEDCAFDLLPILADALEDAGCHDADILGHCRGSCLHVRGCWVVDLLLGKE